MSFLSAPSERAFTERRRADWAALEELVVRARSVGMRKLTGDDVMRISPLYRDICADLSRAQAARYGAPLVEYLQTLTANAHEVFYGQGSRRGRLIEAGALLPGDGVTRAFPRAVRRRWRAIAIASALFFLPLAVAIVLTLRDPGFAFRIAPKEMLDPLTESYAKGFSEGRQASEGALMAGFYVNNNVGIALRCFALGISFGIGSAFYLVFNGLATGAIFGYVWSQGAGQNILTFIVGHSSLELGAIVLAGGAGLSMGWSVIAPGSRTRLASLQHAAADVIVIVIGAAVMLFMAAGVEAFWSASSISSLVKRIVGAAAFMGVMGYLLFGGRSEAH